MCSPPHCTKDNKFFNELLHLLGPIHILCNIIYSVAVPGVLGTLTDGH